MFAIKEISLFVPPYVHSLSDVNKRIFKNNSMAAKQIALFNAGPC